MVALDELSKRNQASWHVEAFTPVPPAPTGVGPKPDEPSPLARRHLWPSASDDGGRFFQSPRRFAPIALIAAAVLTAAGLAIAESTHSPQLIPQGAPNSPNPRSSAPGAAVSSSTTLPGTTFPATTIERNFRAGSLGALAGKRYRRPADHVVRVRLHRRQRLHRRNLRRCGRA